MSPRHLGSLQSLKVSAVFFRNLRRDPLSHPSCIRILRPTAADRMHVMLALSGPRIAVGKRSPQRTCEVIDRLCWPRTRVRLGTALSGTSLPKRGTQAKSSRPQGMRALGRYQL